MSKKINSYAIVFGVVAAIIIVAAISAYLSGSGTHAENLSLSNLKDYGPAPAIQGISAWINSNAINLSSLRGKVVLLDFWTYSCINCIRTIPHLNAWYDKYGNNGLVIIGVSTPEFGFEKNYSNVLSAVKRFGITYPVALDNNYSTWNAYHNQYWPADYLIGKNGNIREEQLGEGNYAQTERDIQALLANASYSFNSTLTNASLGVNFSDIHSPEMYLGYQTASEHGTAIGNAEGFHPNQIVEYMPVNTVQPNKPYFSGEWFNAPDSMVSFNNSRLILVYYANKVNIVAGTAGTATKITIKLDGKSLNQTYLGADDRIVNGTAVAEINQSRLYNIVSAPSYGPHILEIDANPAFRIYTFTFG